MHPIGIIANVQRDAAIVSARDVLHLLDARRVPVLLAAELAQRLGAAERGAAEAELARAGLLIAVGGDGTLLAANRIAAPRGIPILGVHAGGPGSFGFLTEVAPAEAIAAVEALLAGECNVETRLMVAAEVVRRGKTVAHPSGLNDLVIRARSRMLRLGITVGETFIATYAADGIVVATPTGSTAYNLAAGGPLVNPRVETILLTPICPHTLNVRSLLIGEDDVIHAELETGERDETLLTVDGQVSVALEPGDVIRFGKSEQQGRFVSLNGPNFYEKVQTRLRLGERFGS
jgi:NAD+ kinase